MITRNAEIDYTSVPLEVAKTMKKKRMKMLLERLVNKHYEQTDREMLSIKLMTGNDNQKVECGKVLAWIESLYHALYTRESVVDAVTEENQNEINFIKLDLSTLAPVDLLPFKEIALLPA